MTMDFFPIVKTVAEPIIKSIPSLPAMPMDLSELCQPDSGPPLLLNNPVDLRVVTPFLVKHISDSTTMAPASVDNFHDFCYRHNPEITCKKSADEDKMERIQKELEKLPNRDKEAINHVWTIFLAAPTQHRKLILLGLLSQCCFPQLSYISQEVQLMIRIDFILILPAEISLKILCSLDFKLLCNAALVSKNWRRLADNDRVWHFMCKQHIDRKCPNCGWGLPLHIEKAAIEANNRVELLADTNSAVTTVAPPAQGRSCDEPARKRLKKRPWKLVYLERFLLERNWRKGIYKVQTFNGHTDGVTCLKFHNKLLMTGSYDTTIRIWNTETGECTHTLSGHTRGVRLLAFDLKILISGSLDKTIKVWNYRSGECIATYRGHEDHVVAVDLYKNIIVLGLADHTVKVWHVDLRTCYTLRGHTDWVNCVKIHPQLHTVFSCSDDTLIRMWDLNNNQCIRTFECHVGQVQCVIPFTYNEQLVADDEEVAGATTETTDDGFAWLSRYPTHLLTLLLDNTIKLWDIRSGKCIRTQFGHVEGVWLILADTFRVVSGAHDKLIKVWDLQNGKCLHTFGNNASVSCVGLSDSHVAAGLEDGTVKMYRFDVDANEVAPKRQKQVAAEEDQVVFTSALPCGVTPPPEVSQDTRNASGESA